LQEDSMMWSKGTGYVGSHPSDQHRSTNRLVKIGSLKKREADLFMLQSSAESSFYLNPRWMAKASYRSCMLRYFDKDQVGIYSSPDREYFLENESSYRLCNGIELDLSCLSFEKTWNAEIERINSKYPAWAASIFTWWIYRKYDTRGYTFLTKGSLWIPIYRSKESPSYQSRLFESVHYIANHRKSDIENAVLWEWDDKKTSFQFELIYVLGPLRISYTIGRHPFLNRFNSRFKIYMQYGPGEKEN
jgi:hypothetical protein